MLRLETRALDRVDGVTFAKRGKSGSQNKKTESLKSRPMQCLATSDRKLLETRLFLSLLWGMRRSSMVPERSSDDRVGLQVPSFATAL